MKTYRVNIAVEESVDWDTQNDLYYGSFVADSKEDATRIAKLFFEILCTASDAGYNKGWEDCRRRVIRQIDSFVDDIVKENEEE